MKLLAFVLLMVTGVAVADALTPVSPPFDWGAVFVALIVGAAVVGVVWYMREHPGAAAKAKVELKELQAALEAKLKDLGDNKPSAPVPQSPPPPVQSSAITPGNMYQTQPEFFAFVAAYTGMVTLDGKVVKSGAPPGVNYMSTITGIVKLP